VSLINSDFWKTMAVTIKVILIKCKTFFIEEDLGLILV
jgi:hypothetical protein